jgi:hypothetical protein
MVSVLDRTCLMRSARALAFAVTLLCGALPAAAQEGESEAIAPPPHAIAALSVGAPLRITRNVDFDQEIIAPVFMDVLLGYTLWTRGWQHGLGLGASLNMTEDGGFTEPVGSADQLVLMPAYLGYHALNDDFALLGHLGVPIVLGETRTAGVELALGGGYRFLAGVLAYAELGSDLFIGAGTTANMLVSLELGVMLDYEVLP